MLANYLRRVLGGGVIRHKVAAANGVKLIEQPGPVSLLLPAAKAGHPEAVAILREHAADRLEAGMPLSPDLEAWLADYLRNGRTTGGSGRPKAPAEWVGAVGADVARAVNLLAEQRRCSKAEAVEGVAEFLGCDPSAIWQAIKGHNPGDKYSMPHVTPGGLL